MSAQNISVYLLTGDCGSVYCNGHHPVGIFASRQEAEAIQPSDLQCEYGQAYMALHVVELPVGEALVADHLRHGCH